MKGRNYAELPAGAEHPWHWHSDPIKGDPLGRSRYEITTLGRTITRTYYSDPTALKEAAYIAAANPQAVLALITEIERLQVDGDRYGYLRRCVHLGGERAHDLRWYVPKGEDLTADRLDAALAAARSTPYPDKTGP